jgi:hypothetical protein
MAHKSERKPDDPAQYKRFLEAARKAQADESEEGADRAFRKVTSSSKAKPSKRD